MSDFTGMSDLVEQIGEVSCAIAQGDDKFNHRLDGIEKSVDALYRITHRPGFGGGDDASFERKSAIEMCKSRRRGRPPGPVPKRPVTIRLDTDVIAHFQAAGAGWQSRINAALRRAAGLSTPAQ